MDHIAYSIAKGTMLLHLARNFILGFACPTASVMIFFPKLLHKLLVVTNRAKKARACAGHFSNKNKHPH
jgi:hypothetical protein